MQTTIHAYRPRLPLAILLLALTFWVTIAPPRLRAASTILLHAEPRSLEVLHNNRTLLTYPFATNQFKPYVRELISLDGVDLLRDAPADHLHHHGLMYGIKVNDINFWEEAPKAGRQIPQAELIREVKKDSVGRPLSLFKQVLHWIGSDPDTAPDTSPLALLIENRTIAVAVDAATEQIHLEWQSDFTVGPATPQVILTGSSYHGLGIRFRADFDGVAERRNSDNLPYPDDGQQGVLPARWMAVSHVTAGRPYTLTLFNHPSNPGNPRFFSMQKPFTYLSATQGLDEAPLSYRSGDRWSIKYLLLVSPRRMSNEQLDRQYESFARPRQ
jgi:hypothetical protein